ncbi:MAG: TonB-dependent receptor [Myxococcota bacterium]
MISLLLVLVAADPGLNASDPRDELDVLEVRGEPAGRGFGEGAFRAQFIGQERIRGKGAVNLVEALRFEPGIRLDNTCSICNETLIKLGGLPGRYSLVTVDGLPLYTSLGQPYGLLNINSAEIARIEVVKGASSVIPGPDAVSGWINIVTKKPAPDGTAESQAEAGTFAYRRLVGTLGTQRDDVSLLLIANGSEHGAVDRDGDQLTEYTGYSRANVAATARFDSEDTRGLLRLSFLQEDRQGGGRGRTLSVVDDFDQDSGLGRRALTETIFTRRLEAGGILTQRINDRIDVEVNSAAAFHRQDSDYATTLYSATQLSWLNTAYARVQLADGYELKTGLSYRFEDTEQSIEGSDYRYHMPGVFAELDTLIADTVQLVGGGRYDYHNEFGSQFTGRLVARYEPAEALVIRASGGTSFRVPSTFFEYAHGIRPAGFTLVDETEGPERGRTAHLSAQYSFGSLATVLVEGSVSQIVDPITFNSTANPDGSEDVTVFSVDDALTVRGLEAQVQSKPMNGLVLGLGFGLYRYDDDGGALVSAPPQEQITASVDYVVPAAGTLLSASADVYGPMPLAQVYGSAVNPRGDASLNDFLAPDTGADPSSTKLDESPWFGIVNARVEQPFGAFSVYIGADNLFDFHQHDEETSIFFPIEEGAITDADTIYIWGPLRGRFIYGGLSVRL